MAASDRQPMRSLHQMDVSSLPELPDEEEDVLGAPSFEVLIRDGRALTSGSYFMSPPIYMKEAKWDSQKPNRLVVTADDGSIWYADIEDPRGRSNAVMHRAP
jgi:hypothetical protein